MANRNQPPAKQTPLAWRITQVFLHILGKLLLWVMILVATLAVVGAIAGVILYQKFSDYIKSDVIPKAEEYADSLQLDNIALAQTSILYCKDPKTDTYKEMQQLYSAQNRIWVSYEDIPKDLIHAAVAIEDRRFMEHNGVDWLRTLSAVKNFLGGDSSFGASTITQQLIKNLSQEDDVTINRKVQEIFRALAVEELYTKEEILEWYLNTIYLGEGCYGVQSAAKVYFAKDLSELTAAECACLIGITNNPSMYDPYIAPQSNLKRQQIILAEMNKRGYFESEEAYEEAKNQELVFRNGLYDNEEYQCSSCGYIGERSEYMKDGSHFFCPLCNTENLAVDKDTGYSYFVDTVYRDVVDDLCEQYDLSQLAAQQLLLTSGWKIYTTMDPEVQALLDGVYEDLDNIPKTVSIQQLQSAMVIIDNATGDIVAMTGGVGQKEGSLTFNRAESRLPTGSAIKPIAVYAPAIEAGLITPVSVYEDSSIYEDRKWPQNYYRKYSGVINIVDSVKQSLNTISVKVLQDLSVEASYAFLTQKLGVTTLVQSVEKGGKEYTDIALAPLGLGELTYGMTVREVTQAYATFPNDGVFREARTYTTVIDPEGNIILDNTQESHTAMSKKTSFYMNYMLQKVVEEGTGKPAAISNVPSGGKTGTSHNDQTRWYAGYTPYYTAVVWCGYDEPEEIVLKDNSTNPAIALWRQVMRPLHEGLEWRSFTKSSDVGTYNICIDCGLLAEEKCKTEMRGDRTKKYSLYWQDAPKEKCNCHIEVEICTGTGKLCNSYCELSRDNSVKKVTMLLLNKDWKETKNMDHIFDPEKAEENTCTTHNLLSLIIPPSPDENENTETDPQPDSGGNTDPTTPAPTTPTIPQAQETTPQSTAPSTGSQWYEGNIITGGY
ncbi:MAG: transglycosylase domain-containing protein [Oscillospiraceae bacterium]|nr:transglycosylase domain-containing protein [Oscillospiraceae bacterium]